MYIIGVFNDLSQITVFIRSDIESINISGRKSFIFISYLQTIRTSDNLRSINGLDDQPLK